MHDFLCVHDQTFVRSCPDFLAFTRLSCVHVQTFVRSCPDFPAFTRLSCVHVQTFVRSCPDFRAFMFRLSCVHVQFLCVHVQTFVRSPDFRAFMFRLSCVHVQTFVRSTDFRAFMFRLFAFFGVSRLCNFERTTPPSCVHLRSGHTCFRLGSPQPGSDFATLISEKFWKFIRPMFTEKSTLISVQQPILFSRIFSNYVTLVSLSKMA